MTLDELKTLRLLVRRYMGEHAHSPRVVKAGAQLNTGINRAIGKIEAHAQPSQSLQP